MENLAIPISKVQWTEDYKKLGNEYRTDERNLIQSFLQTDYHLSKIFNQLLRTEVDQDEKHFKAVDKQLKFFINEAYSYVYSNNPSKVNNAEFRTKIKKIDDLLIKCQKEYRNRFESLLSEEEKLEKELAAIEENFDKEFNNNTMESNDTLEFKIIENKEEDDEAFKSAQSKRINSVDQYIANIMNQNNVIYTEDEKNLYLHDLKKQVKKFGNKDLEILKEKTVYIDNLVDKKLGGINLGWQQKEHEEFMKLKISFNGKINSFEFLNELSDLIPYLPRSELKCHIKVYDKFSHLMEVKKILIMRYKEIKTQIEEEEKRKILENLNKQREEKKQSLAKNNFDPEIINQKKMQVKEWKEKKEKMEKEQLRNNRKNEKILKEKEREKYLIKKERNQILIDEYKRKKEIEKQNQMLEEQMNNQVIVSQLDINRIQEREELLLEKRKSGIQARQKKITSSNAEDALIAYKLMSVNKIRPDNKINGTTEAYKNRQRAKFDPKNDKPKDACTMANNLLGRGTRAIPVWRKGL